MNNDQSSTTSDGDVVVRKKGESFFLHYPKWQLIVQGTDLNQTYQELCSQIDVLDSRFQEAGFELQREQKPDISQPSSNRSFMEHFLNTIAGTLGISLIIGLFLFLAIELLGQRFTNAQNSIQEIVHVMSTPAEWGKTAINGVVLTADTIKMWTPERKAELRESLRIIVQEVRPFAEELRPFFDTSRLESTEGSPPVRTTIPPHHRHDER